MGYVSLGFIVRFFILFFNFFYGLKYFLNTLFNLLFFVDRKKYHVVYGIVMMVLKILHDLCCMVC